MLRIASGVSKEPKDLGVLPIPHGLRYDETKPFKFGLAMNILLGVACTFLIANLFYCQPLLIQFSESFGVSYEEASRAPLLLQIGYVVGLLLLAPLGDLVRRRQLVLILLFLSSCLALALSLSPTFKLFLVFSFLAGLVNVTPQVLLTLAADLSSDARRGFSISIVLSGLILGVLLARVLAGVIAEFVSWNVVYYFAAGVQALVLAGCYVAIPDYPAKNRDLGYGKLLWSMAKLAVTEPVLIQACLVNLLSAACLSNFWVTLTFLLGADPYHYPTLVIGLFALVGMVGVFVAPLVGKLVDHLVPWHASVIGVLIYAAFQSILVGAAGVHIAAVLVAMVGLDMARQMLQVSLQAAIFAISASARARINALFLLSLFAGQSIGSAAGSTVFLQHGWRAGAALSLGWTACGLLLLLLRGPHCSPRTWFGYEGGIAWVKSKDAERKDIEASSSDMGEKAAEPSTASPSENRQSPSTQNSDGSPLNAKAKDSSSAASVATNSTSV